MSTPYYQLNEKIQAALKELYEMKQQLQNDKQAFIDSNNQPLAEYEKMSTDAKATFQMVAQKLAQEKITDTTMVPNELQKKLNTFKDTLLKIAQQPEQTKNNKARLESIMKDIDASVQSISLLENADDFKNDAKKIQVYGKLLSSTTDQLVLTTEGQIKMREHIDEGTQGFDKHIAEIDTSINQMGGKNNQLTLVEEYGKDANNNWKKFDK